MIGQLLGEDVENALDVVVGVEEAMVFLEEELFELGVIDDIAVVGHDDPERRIDLEGLSVLAPAAADGGVAGVAEADVAGQALGMLGGEDISDQSVAFFCVEAAVVGDDAGRVLTPVLDSQQPLVEVTENVAVAEDTDHTAHE